MEVFSVGEAAAKLKVSDDVVYALLKSRRLRGRKVGRDWRITDADIDEYLNTMTIEEAMNGDLRDVLEGRRFTDGERTAYGYSPSKDYRYDVRQQEDEVMPLVIFVPGPEVGGASGFPVSVVPSDTIWRR